MLMMMTMTPTLLASITGEVGDILMVTTGGLRITRRVDTSDTPTPAPPSRLTVYKPASPATKPVISRVHMYCTVLSPGLSLLMVRETKSEVRSTVNLSCEMSRLIDAALCDNSQ